MDFVTACRILDLEEVPTPNTMTIKNGKEVLEIFYSMLDGDDIKNDVNATRDLLQAKNELLFEVFKNKSSTNKNFKFDFSLPIFAIKNKCRYCGGSGVRPLYQVAIIPEMDKCLDCMGTGIQHRGCKECHSTGWIGGNVCEVCEGKRRIPIKGDTQCIHCRGIGYVDRIVNTGILIHHTHCTVCDGFGIASMKGYISNRKKNRK